MARCDELAAYTSMTDGIERVLPLPRARPREPRGRPLDARGRAGHVAGRGRQPVRAPGGAATRRRRRSCSARTWTPCADAGRYDGILGVLMAIEVVRALRPQVGSLPLRARRRRVLGRGGRPVRHRAAGRPRWPGRWNEAWWDLTDEHGITLRTAFSEFGLDPGRIGTAARSPSILAGYLEAHIEQGPELDDGGAPLGVVTSIASARRFAVQIDGEARHAGGARTRSGTTPWSAPARSRSPSSGSAAPSTTSSARSAAWRRSPVRSTWCPARHA